MCFGGGAKESAEEIYQKKKPTFGELPSLSTKAADREAPKMGDVPKQRKGMERRSLLNPMGVYSAKR